MDGLYNCWEYTTFICVNLIVQIMSETLPDLTDLLPPSDSDASIALNTSIADIDLLKLFA